MGQLDKEIRAVVVHIEQAAFRDRDDQAAIVNARHKIAEILQEKLCHHQYDVAARCVIVHGEVYGADMMIEAVRLANSAQNKGPCITKQIRELPEVRDDVRVAISIGTR